LDYSKARSDGGEMPVYDLQGAIGSSVVHNRVRGSSRQKLKVEGVRVEGSLLIATVRNIGSVDLVVDRVFIKEAGDTLYTLNVEAARLK